jgi:CheY-like chemotaxis protein
MTNYKNLLLIEDDKDDQEFFTEVLSGVYHSVSCEIASNGHKALQLLPTLSTVPDLIFLDLNMPVMDGREFLRLIKTDAMYAAFSHIPVVILTTSGLDKQKCYELGACLYITKPTSINAFRDILKHVLSRDVVKDSEILRAIFSGQQHPAEKN